MNERRVGVRSLAESQQFFLEITSELTNLARVAQFVEQVGHAFKMTRRELEDVQMAVDEAVTNVIEHGYGGRRDGQIQIRFALDQRTLVVEIRDFGKPFDARQVKAPKIRGPLSRRPVRGLGIFFIKKLMDEVEFSRDAYSNLTRMTKRLT